APSAIVLLSDGYTNIGRPSATAATEAGERGIPVYTIAYGTPWGYVVDDGRREPVPVNPEELAEVAKLSGGKTFEAGSSQELKVVYESIARSVGYVTEDREITEQFVGYALALAGLAALALMSLAARWP
ncbi:MAG: magnesium chelatase, partial [Propionibacteriaceae bacterium]|nr:magnesium chelatase [Propionibacteriaceae bacterium]